MVALLISFINVIASLHVDAPDTLCYVFFHSIQPNINYLLSKLNILEGRHLFI